MKKQLLIGLLLLAVNTITYSQVTDAPNCKDHPMFNRMPNTIINECSTNFDLVEVPVSADKTESKEGNKSYIAYGYNYESGAPPPSFYQIFKNYETAIVSKGGKKVLYKGPNDGGVASFNMRSAGKEMWVVLQDFGGVGEGQYGITVLEMEPMKQEIVANAILEALNKEGSIALYINFETGKSTILPESQKIVDQLAEMLTANPEMKISVEGHTDNVGAAASNKTLSENRARSVMNALIAKGIDKSKLSAKGWGQAKPISDNNTEDGRAKNRRVEIVKL